MKQFFSFITATLLGSSLFAQTTFTVATMNVDGLPEKVAMWDVNPEGPGTEGTLLISQRVAQKGYDILGVSEDFNHNGSLMEWLNESYDCGTFRGAIDASASFSAIFAGLTFDTDGLNLLWKKTMNAYDESWTRWNDWNGKFDNGFDGLIKKGFRYYRVEVEPGMDIDVYIMHMDAETSDKDIEAREKQWAQLRDAILQTNNGRPKIVMGDTNCRYTRDNVKGIFIDAIEASGLYTVKDAWVELCKRNKYPTLGADALMADQLGYREGEIVDKVLYINPTFGRKLKATSFKVDTDFNKEDGTPLADHYPVVVKFRLEGEAYGIDNNWSWTDCSETDKLAYNSYVQIYRQALPYINFPLPEDMLSDLNSLLHTPTSLSQSLSSNSVTTKLGMFIQSANAWIEQQYAPEDATDELYNPSFEMGKRLESGNVYGWTVASDVWEAFVSGVEDNEEGAAVRNFEPHDGNYIFNTWGGSPENGFFCLQKRTLSSGIYKLSAIVASTDNNIVNLRFGNVRMPSAPLNDRTIGVLVETYAYHEGGSATIGLESDTWFEADDFHLIRYNDIPTGLTSTEAPSATAIQQIYTPDGKQVTSPQRGINLLRLTNGTVRKVIIP